MNLEFREVTVKVVYYGPALSGKTTNLQVLHRMFDSHHRGRLMSLETQSDRTLFFDLLPIQYQTPTGLKVKLKLFTVPGQVLHNETRKAVLSGADAVVFVADSQRSQALSNSMSFKNLKENLRVNSLDFETIPIAIQFNKRDLAEIKPVEEIKADWGETRFATFLAIAGQGQGVFETFECVVRMGFDAINRKYDFNKKFGFNLDTFVQSIKGEKLGEQVDLKKYLVTPGSASGVLK